MFDLFILLYFHIFLLFSINVALLTILLSKISYYFLHIQKFSRLVDKAADSYLENYQMSLEIETSVSLNFQYDPFDIVFKTRTL